MRPLKFRAWDKESKKFVHGENLANPNSIPVINYGDSFELKSKFEITQWTGLTDRHGKEIWEGDILELGYKDFVQIIFDEGSFKGKKDEWISSLWDYKPIQMTPEQTGFWHRCEVIGNIYSNPELLGK